MGDPQCRQQLVALERALCDQAQDLAVFFVFDRPSLVQERPALARTFFAERCLSEVQLKQMTDSLDAVGAHTQLFDSHAFVEALAGGIHKQVNKRLIVAYNGLGYSVGRGAFEPGRKSLVPLLADSYGLLCANADPYACAFTLHKFHCFSILKLLGAGVPRTWHFRPSSGWLGDAPPHGTKVIVKSNYESWSVGVTEESVFIADESCTDRVHASAQRIGQPVTVQEYIAGPEVCVPVLSCPERIASQPVELVLERTADGTDMFMTIDDTITDEGISYRPFGGEVGARVQDSARRIVELLDLRGLSRIDFRVDRDGVPWAFDVAISPGIAANGSAFVSLAEYVGFDHAAFIRLVIAATLGAHGVLDA